MVNQLIISGAASALLLAALLAACARADDVTAQCPVRDESRLRLYPTDIDALWLSMQNCGLTEVNSDSLAGLPNLNGVSLNNNKIQSINLTALQSSALRKLWLSHNELRELPVLPQPCPSLRELALAFNQLQGIDSADAFSACVTIRVLELDHNHIEFVHLDAFSPLTDLTELFLSSNRISYISDRTFSKNSKLQLLFLHDNKITHLPPDFASHLKRTSARLDKFTIHENPWHCACLLEVLAYTQRAGVHDRFSANNHGMPACVHDALKYKCRDIRELSTLLFNKR